MTWTERERIMAPSSVRVGTPAARPRASVLLIGIGGRATPDTIMDARAVGKRVLEGSRGYRRLALLVGTSRSYAIGAGRRVLLPLPASGLTAAFSTGHDEKADQFPLPPGEGQGEGGSPSAFAVPPHPSPLPEGEGTGCSHGLSLWEKCRVAGPEPRADPG